MKQTGSAIKSIATCNVCQELVGSQAKKRNELDSKSLELDRAHQETRMARNPPPRMSEIPPVPLCLIQDPDHAIKI